MSRICHNCHASWSLDYDADGNTVAHNSDTLCPQCGDEGAVPHDDGSAELWSDKRYACIVWRKMKLAAGGCPAGEWPARLQAIEREAQIEVYGEERE